MRESRHYNSRRARRARRASVGYDATLEVFPLPASTNYSYAPGWTSVHQGTDIFAPLGTPVLAVRDGTARSSIEPKPGRCIYLVADDGTQFFYGHLAGWSLPVMRPEGARVLAGDQIGIVGNDGNAAGKPHHLHFQIRTGSAVLDPFPFLQKADTHPNKPELPPMHPGIIDRVERVATGVGTGLGAGIALIALLYAFGKSR